VGKVFVSSFLQSIKTKKAVIIAPTISLMQDQVYKLNKLGIPSVFLGSEQIDKSVEAEALMPEARYIEYL